MGSIYVKKAVTFLNKADITISGTWVDCGCGRGVYSNALIILGADLVLAIDITIKSGFFLKKKILKIKGDCKNVPVKNKIVSGFIYVNVLHYHKDPGQLIKEAYRVLDSTGVIIIIEYKRQIPTPWNPHPLKTDEITHLLKAHGFSMFKTALVDTGYRPKQLVVAGKYQQKNQLNKS
ncbi:MAG: methyltransferase domain-containing protein [Candidatus Methanofastidiosia archaeon]|jgi:SAM-dependent methyltransferase